MIPKEKAESLVAIAKQMELTVPAKFHAMTIEEMANVANGIGPQAFPEALRRAIDARHPVLEVVAFIHDIEWDENDGMRTSFEQSNKNFLSNGIKAACYTFPMLSVGRYVVMWDAYKLYRLLNSFGWAFYLMASAR